MTPDPPLREEHPEYRTRAGSFVDAVLEVPVAPSFSRIGYDVRSRLDRWRPLDSYDLSDRVVVVTGPTSGLGLATARRVATLGATVVLLGRDRDRTGRVADEIVGATGNDRVSVALADMADPEAVRRAADEILDAHPAIDTLIHNAGALHPDRREAQDGTELTVAAQVVGPFLLTAQLFDRLRASAPSRVITVSSGGMYAASLDVEHLEMGDDYRGTEQYARAKRAQVTLNELWAERLDGQGVRFHAMHPGWADTPGVAASLPTFRTLTGPLLRSPDQGADTIVWLAADDGEPLATTGRFWHDRRVRATHRLPATRRADTPEERDRLWAWCVEHAGVDPAA
ncbi:MAG: SDR family NAD(P)-dependent oxidoreductase [Acidimicrobiales bacterium]|jgi:NAD(P)-dependent dehydrogenase (short-subunit alcohol dehydrogenase family)|nr:SDR family NAD(P)-dependent oxidoreductase [Acidimicrobiales bacterium]